LSTITSEQSRLSWVLERLEHTNLAPIRKVKALKRRLRT